MKPSNYEEIYPTDADNDASTSQQSEQRNISLPDSSIDDEAIYNLWDDLSDFGVFEIDKALTHCLNSLCGMIGAQNAMWIGAVCILDEDERTTDPMSGWRAKSIEVLNVGSVRQQQISSFYNLPKTGPGETTKAITSGAGTFRVHSLRSGLVDLAAFQKTKFYDQFYRDPDISDRIWIVTPVGKNTESYFIFDAYAEGHFFTVDQLGIVAKALRGIKWFHRLLMLIRGLGVCESPLTPAERRMLPELLKGVSEKVIADRLKLRSSTVHQYATNIYRKFGVCGRAEFMSFWTQPYLKYSI